jgi:4-hydroxybenzoate polyprenyltransferase
MSALRQRLVAVAELSRLSNAPTVVGNALVGCALAADEPSIGVTIAAILAASSLYVGGMAFNDVADAAWDRDHRPSRPIPAGRISRRGAALFATSALATGFVISASQGVAPALICAALIGSVLAYDFTHKRFAAATILMGLCRGLVYVLAAAMIAWPIVAAQIAWPVVLVATYTVLLTLVARSEHEDQAGPFTLVAWLLPILPLVLMLRFEPERWFWVILAGALAFAWILRGAIGLHRRPPRAKQAVLTWLAGFCLIDTLTLTLLDRPSLALVTLGCFIITIIGHRRVPGT